MDTSHVGATGNEIADLQAKKFLSYSFLSDQIPVSNKISKLSQNSSLKIPGNKTGKVYPIDTFLRFVNL